MHTIVEDIENLVINGKTKASLNRLREVLSISDSELLEDIIIISSEYNKLSSDKRKGILSYSEETLHTNKVNNRILSVLKELKEDESIILPFIQTDDKIAKANKELGFKTHSWMQNSILRRLGRLKEDELEKGTLILWIGKRTTSHNRPEIQLLQSIGFRVLFCTTSEEAKKILSEEPIDLVVSSIRREESDTEGLDFLKAYSKARKKVVPFIFYIRDLDRAKGVPGFAFGITTKPNDLLHLIADIVERKA